MIDDCDDWWWFIHSSFIHSSSQAIILPYVTEGTTLATTACRELGTQTKKQNNKTTMAIVPRIVLENISTNNNQISLLLLLMVLSQLSVDHRFTVLYNSQTDAEVVVVVPLMAHVFFKAKRSPSQQSTYWSRKGLMAEIVIELAAEVNKSNEWSTPI